MVQSTALCFNQMSNTIKTFQLINSILHFYNQIQMYHEGKDILYFHKAQKL